MMATQASFEHPDWRAMTSFFLRSRGLQAQRLVRDALRRLPRLAAGAAEHFPYVLAESVSLLHTSPDPREHLLVLGKIENLRLSCRRLNHRVLAPNEVFSLWRQLGPPWRLRGFVPGREVREGCVIPTFGGGLCQLSGSLLEVVTAVDLDLLEMHRHTALPADVLRNPRRDATLFWNYVDLRFRSCVSLLFECFLTGTALVVRLRGRQPRSASVQIVDGNAVEVPSLSASASGSCFTCDKTDCARHVTDAFKIDKTAFLLDEYQPEFARLVRDYIKDTDQVLLPFVSERGWNKSRFGAERDAYYSAHFRLRRSLVLRWSVFRGITVAQAHFELAGALAKSYERRIDYRTEHLCVAQPLLPHLWRSGALGGRTFDVLMQRLPVACLEQQLDVAAQLYPQSKTLGEFRAPRWFVEAEQEALQAARTLFTPHLQIAALYKHAVCLSWEVAPALRNTSGKHRDLLVFMGPTLARKGAYAVREAIRKTELSLTVVGRDLEEPGFWGNLPVTHISAAELPWERIHTVVQPALIEYWPRQLLRAHAAGANLVISPPCGMQEDLAAGIHHVPFGDADALTETLTRLLVHRC
jgi:hypothetical protein